MAKILGINPSPDHDTSACLLLDGKLVAAVEEERFNRQKHTKVMPFRSIQFCLEFAGLTLNDVDCIAIPWSPNSLWRRYGTVVLKRPSIEAMGLLVQNLPFPVKYMHRLYLKRRLGHLPVIKYVSHHYAHACTAFYPSGLDSSSILTIDAVGEHESTVGWNGNAEKIEKVREEPYSNSLGETYSELTEYLGFIPYSDEGKTMGLAPYGKSYVASMKEIIDPEKGRWYKVNNKLYLIPGERKDLDAIERILHQPRRQSPTQLNDNYRDIAFSIQLALEKSLVNVAREVMKLTNNKNLCLSGGIALNCKANGVVREDTCANEFFAFPAANDAGAAIGAAMAVAVEWGDDPTFKMEHSYFGPEFSKEKIQVLLDERMLKYEYHEDIAGVCAELLSEGKIIGWFQGRMELGARALGNRSILADPADDEMKDKVNLKVKKREPWRPFCPSMLFEAKDEYLINPYEAPFMILSFQVPPHKIKEIPAVVHVDGSTRPQTVKREINPLYWSLIKKFESETGVPVLLNTSFNLAGEPIVCTPSDAIRSFFDSGLDHLALGNFLLFKQ